MQPSSILDQLRKGEERTGGGLRSLPATDSEATTDFLERVRALAAGLVAYGLAPGDRAAVVGTFGPDALQGILAVWAAGGTAVPVPPTVAEIDLQGALRNSRTRMVLAVEPSDLRHVVTVRPDLPDLELLLVFRPEGGDRPSPARGTTDVEAAGRFELQSSPGLLLERTSAQSAMVLACSAEGPATRRRDLQDLTRASSELVNRLSLSPAECVVLCLPPSGGLELDAALIILMHGAEIVFGTPKDVAPERLRNLHPTRAILVPEVVRGLERAAETEFAGRSLPGRFLTRWALDAASAARKAPRRARLAEKWVIQGLRERIVGSRLSEILCPGPVPPVPGLRSLGIALRSLGSET